MTAEFGISAEEANALRFELKIRLAALDDLRMAFEDGDFETATRLGARFGDELRLMEDLGWGPDDRDAPITLTMPAEQRCRIFTRLRSSTQCFRRDQKREEREVEEEDRAQRERTQQILHACDRILSSGR